MKYYRGDVLSSLLLHSSLQYDDDVHLFQNFHHKELNAWGQNGLEGDRRRKESTFSTLKLIMRFRSVLPFGIFVLQEEQQPLHPSYITYCIRNNPLIPSFSCLIVSCQCSEKMFGENVRRKCSKKEWVTSTEEQKMKRRFKELFLIIVFATHP